MTNLLTNTASSSSVILMDRQVNLYEAKTHLSRLVDEAAGGDTIIIAKDGKPMARLCPLEPDTGDRLPRRLGQYASAADEVDWDGWWREWKAADREIASDFEASARRPLVTSRARGKKKQRR
jgi:prevent-host-death family protein